VEDLGSYFDSLGFGRLSPSFILTGGNNMKFTIGGFYNWKNQPERLVYMGSKMYPDGVWYQFAKIEDPHRCWSEVRGFELVYFEETK
jgi:hypothetical protein